MFLNLFGSPAGCAQSPAAAPSGLTRFGASAPSPALSSGFNNTVHTPAIAPSLGVNTAGILPPNITNSTTPAPGKQPPALIAGPSQILLLSTSIPMVPMSR